VGSPVHEYTTSANPRRSEGRTWEDSGECRDDGIRAANRQKRKEISGRSQILLPPWTKEVPIKSACGEFGGRGHGKILPWEPGFTSSRGATERYKRD